MSQLLDTFAALPPALIALIVSVIGGLVAQLWLLPRLARSAAEVAKAKATAEEVRIASDTLRAMVEQRDKAIAERERTAKRMDKVRDAEVSRLERQIDKLKDVAASLMTEDQRRVFVTGWDELATLPDSAALDYPKPRWPAEEPR